MKLGLDISTSVVGLSIVDDSGYVVSLTNIDLRKIDGVWSKADVVATRLPYLVGQLRNHLSGVYIEENLARFRPGFSSASTLITLARFNGIVSYIVLKEFGIEPFYINVN